MTVAKMLVEAMIAAENAAERICVGRDCVDCPRFDKGLGCHRYLVADHLLANGVVMLPFKAGEKVYIVGHRFPSVIDEIVIDLLNGVTFNWVEHDKGPEVTELWDDGWFTLADIGKTVFLTHEEAEAALKEAEKRDGQ